MSVEDFIGYQDKEDNNMDFEIIDNLLYWLIQKYKLNSIAANSIYPKITCVTRYLS